MVSEVHAASNERIKLRMHVVVRTTVVMDDVDIFSDVMNTTGSAS